MTDDSSCSIESRRMANATLPALTVQALKQKLAANEIAMLLDVREVAEHETARINGSQLIPLKLLPTRIADVPREGLVVVHCHHGGRSGQAVEFLRAQGFTNVVNLTGGIDAWSLEIDQTVPRY